MSARLIAIGDIHGCSAAFDAVVNAVDPRPEDTLVLLGDYVDRGPDSRGVLDRILALRGLCRVVPILGNHDEVMLASRRDPRVLAAWLQMGGDAALDSYGVDHPADVPREHLRFLASCVDFHEADRHFFAHGSYDPTLPLKGQNWSSLRWEGLRDGAPGPHIGKKVAILGHTSQKDGQILDLGHLICIDTCCYGDGWLTALDVESGVTWQARRDGTLRENPPRLPSRRLG